MNHRQKRLSARRLALAALLCMAPIQGAWAAPEPAAPEPLGTASNFAVLAGTAVTCEGAGVVTGNLGALAGVTGFPGSCEQLAGTIASTADALTANGDFLTAYAALDAIPCPTDAPHLLSGDLGGLTLSPGIYCISGPADLTSQLTLKGGKGGGKGADWIFLGDSITASGGGSVAMAKGGQACNVYWQFATAATFIDTDFLGNILAGTKITFTGSSLVGRALAKAEVTMASGDEITGCAGKQHGNPH